MFKVALFTAAALSVIGCAAYDVMVRVELIRTQRAIAQEEAVLRQHGAAYQELLAFQQRKDELQKRIDLVDEVHRIEGNTADAFGILNAVGSEAAAIESVSFVDAKKVVVHGRAESEQLIQSAASKLGLKIKYEAKP